MLTKKCDEKERRDRQTKKTDDTERRKRQMRQDKTDAGQKKSNP